MDKNSNFLTFLNRTARLCTGLLLFFNTIIHTAAAQGITEQSPSRSNYFDWINSEWPGTHEKKVMANLDFFEWMYDSYGMIVDIYHIDAGNIDRSPSFIPGDLPWDTRVGMAYGHIDSARFRRNFPNGFEPIVNKASEIDMRMGIWLGPDGYGDTPWQAYQRRSMLVKFCKDYNFGLFKFDRACTQLDKSNEDEFVKTMEICRYFTPDLITLNHRIELSEQANQHMTTWLWESKETYVDVHIWNEKPATHHRLGNLSRGLPPNLSRLTEDHGVCLSSCMDHWEDDLILQAFNRSLILAPEIYGSPFLLSDDEFPRLARIFNLHRQHKDLLVNGMVLPEAQYGPHAVSRGDDHTRLISLRNLDWETKDRIIKLDESIGLTKSDVVHVRQYHPVELYLGKFDYGTEVAVPVLPFQACLVKASTANESEPGIIGSPYRITRNAIGQPLEIDLLGMPGTTKTIRLDGDLSQYQHAYLDGNPVPFLLKGDNLELNFPGTPLSNNYHRKLSDLQIVDAPSFAQSLFDATCYAADNNALEVRSLERSGPTTIPEVKKARKAFFEDSTFYSKGIWDKYAFDGDMTTSFNVRTYATKSKQVEPGCFRLDFGKPIAIDRLIFKGTIDTLQSKNALVSPDLESWKKVAISRRNNQLEIKLPGNEKTQYFKIPKTPVKIAEIEGYFKNESLQRNLWRASNLFETFEEKNLSTAWQTTIQFDQIPENSYLAIAIPGNYGNENAYAALKSGDKYIGAPDRSPSFESNHWEHVVHRVDGNYTYYFPLSKNEQGKTLEAFVLGFGKNMDDVVPELWITAYPAPYKTKKLVLE